MSIKKHTCTAAVLGLASAAALASPHWTDPCNVVWTTPSKDAAGSMPMGNGQVGINLWVEENGDLRFYISRTDSYSEISRLLKVGAVRISITPNPFSSGTEFRQELVLKDGVCVITAGEDNKQVTLKIFVDSGSPVVYCTGESASPVGIRATVESWRTERRATPKGEEQNSAWTLRDAPFELTESADVFPKDTGNAAAWYHRNEESTAFESTIKVQSLESIVRTVQDPILHRTFGGWVAGPGLEALGELALATPSPVTSFSLCVAAPCKQTATTEAWLDEAKKIAAAANPRKAMKRTAEWWQEFWNRSWVVVGDNESKNSEVYSITRAYTLQRYMEACGGRGPFPIKFNGSMFTVEPKAAGKPYNADWRNWGDCHWWQNLRLPYHPMLANGDFEMMQPMFDMFERVRPLCEARAKLYHGAEGCYFPETMTVWGAYANGDYGWNRTGKPANDVQSTWWRYTWNQGPELVALMLDRWDYTSDEAFLKKQVLPMAESVLKYFDTRFKKDASGKIILDPTQSVETFWHGVINDAPTVAGLQSVTARLCALPQKLTTPTQRAFFSKMKAACPDVPVEEAQVDGKTVRRLAPAKKYKPERSNCENPELYPIWPFKLYGIGKPGLEEALEAYSTRVNHLDVGWGYDSNCAAILGLTDEAARILKIKAANSNGAYRWPATWGPNFDWLPDQDHGSNLLLTTQLMLVQADGDKIRLLPAWPRDWDVSFRLHAPKRTVVECVYRMGKIETLKVMPESRRKDVVMPD